MKLNEEKCHLLMSGHKYEHIGTVLTHLSTLLNEKQRRRLFKDFLESQFNYCPLIWMFHSRTLNSKINKLQE